MGAKRGRKTLPRRLAKWSAVVVLLWGGLTGGAVLGLRFVNPPTTMFMLRREAQLRAEKPASALRHIWVPLERISPHLRLAVVAAEDQRFPTHAGFDVQAIEDAIEDRLEGKGTRGASTLTQQVAKNLFLWSGRSFVRKGLEAYFTVLLEACWPKRRILEVYLNVAELGPRLFGAEAASRAYFGKPSAALSLEEAAQLAVVLPSPRTRRPGALSPQVLERAEWVIDQANRLGLTYVTALE